MTLVGDLTVLLETLAAGDEFYVYDASGAVERKITALNLNAAGYRGALVSRSGALTAQDLTGGTGYQAAKFDNEVYDLEQAAGRNRLWLGVNATVTFTNATDHCDLTAHGFITGDGPFQFTTTGSLPAELATGTDYWAIRVDDDNFKIASSLANALAETAIALGDDGTATTTIDREHRLVIPPGINWAKISASLSVGAIGAGSWLRVNILKGDGAGGLTGEYAGVTGDQSERNSVSEWVNCSSPWLAVTPGEYFSCRWQSQSDTSVDVNSNGLTWAQIEVKV